MNAFRSHILRMCTAWLLVAGLMSYLLRPADSDYSAARFANWLESASFSDEIPGLREELSRMRASGADFSALIQKATHLISTSGSESSGDAEEIYQVLLEEWNQFRTGSSMAAVPVPSTIKPQVPSHMDTYMGPEPARSADAIKSVRGEAKQPAETRTAPLDYHAIPLSGGTAIGAP